MPPQVPQEKGHYQLLPLPPITLIFGGDFLRRGPSEAAFASCVGVRKTWSRTEIIDALEKSRVLPLPCVIGWVPFYKHFKMLTNEFPSCLSLALFISLPGPEEHISRAITAPFDFNHKIT